MNKEKIQKIDNLTMHMNFDLTILYNAIKNADEELEICMLEHFIKKIYEDSDEIRNIFYNDL